MGPCFFSSVRLNDQAYRRSIPAGCTTDHSEYAAGSSLYAFSNLWETGYQRVTNMRKYQGFPVRLVHLAPLVKLSCAMTPMSDCSASGSTFLHCSVPSLDGSSLDAEAILWKESS